MKHMTEEELIAYREGVADQGALISKHLAACEECLLHREQAQQQPHAAGAGPRTRLRTPDVA